ncbi:phospholipase D-like domain-containing protein [Halobacillus naozhouensis]|uniref:phospholipase D n=1 Tax=Halobacillus naozhouensis TaxID=554880 RepID=A0ABY8J1B6_9BACI|nr:phospholipase D-like domain-containing protein [Halobacillus naozhouensis]WFT75871.1 phospholipase D-like domain-containing protein [Halobacillus naozhouensis]
MDLVITAGTTLLIGSISYGVYKFSQKDHTEHIPLTPVEYVFTKSNKSPKQKVKEVIDHTKKTLDVAMFLLTETDFVTQITKATKRGVNVRVITDRTQTSDLSKQTANIQKLIEAGVPVKVNTYDGNMHLKVMISDQNLVTTGSYNFTYSAENKNDEVLVVIRGKKIGEEWTDKFDSMWNDSSHYSPYSQDTDEKYA